MIQEKVAIEILKLLAAAPNLAKEMGTMPNIKMKTMGGEVFWNDIAEHKGWRVQRLWTGHYRILDPKNTRHAWGGEKAIMELFDKLLKKPS